MRDTSIRYKLPAVVLGLVIFFSHSTSFAHCQIPCGIYDDAARVAQMLEDSNTVTKSVRSLAELTGKNDPQSVNQRVRWVMNKEEHAQKIIETISNYFLTQRVKSNQGDYVDRLKKHHAVITAAMKAKQSASQDKAMALKTAIEALSAFYPAHTD